MAAPTKTVLDQQVKDTFRVVWEEQSTKAVPDPTDLRLGANHAKNLESATVLYADLDGSTAMVDVQPWFISAEVYKNFLRCASQIIRGEDGVITAYDGDRVMAVFTGDMKNTRAVRVALRINYAVKQIIQPAFDAQYVGRSLKIAAICGIDTSQLRATRIGVHGDNDITWVGSAANYAAKLTSLPDAATWITKAVYDSMADEAKYTDGTKTGTNMWTSYTWNTMNGMQIYGSNYWWGLSI